MSKITSIDQLIECFDNAEPSEQVSVLKRIDIPLNEFDDYATWKKGDYTRNCIARREGFEFILLCWDNTAITPIHGHDGQNCWVYQVDGEICEKRYVESDSGFKVTNEANLTPGKISFMHDRMGFHTIENISETRAMTLHVYANPIDSCLVYCDEKQEFEEKDMVYDTMPDHLLQNAG